MGKVIAAHAVVLLEVADDRLNGRASSDVAYVDFVLVLGRSVVAAVFGIGDDDRACCR
jgi:hypothetical protein